MGTAGEQQKSTPRQTAAGIGGKTRGVQTRRTAATVFSASFLAVEKMFNGGMT